MEEFNIAGQMWLNLCVWLNVSGSLTWSQISIYCIIRQQCLDHSCYGKGFSNIAKELKCSTAEEMQKFLCFTWKLLDWKSQVCRICAKPFCTGLGWLQDPERWAVGLWKPYCILGSVHLMLWKILIHKEPVEKWSFFLVIPFFLVSYLNFKYI